VVLGGHDYLCGVLPVGGDKAGTVVNVGGTWDVIQATLPAFHLPQAAAGTGWTVEPHVAPGRFSAFGAAIGGAVTGWFRDEFLADLAADDDAYHRLAARAAGQRGGSVMFLPHLAGATGPVMDSHAAGAFVGLRAGHDRTDLLAAVFEGLNFQTREILESTAVLGVNADRLVFVGGSSRNAALVQAKADTLGLPVDVPEVAETTCLGAAMLAGLGAGVFGSMDEAAEAMKSPTKRTEPDPAQADFIARRLGLFRDLYQALKQTHHKLGGYRQAGD
jgi:xylulokinase